MKQMINENGLILNIVEHIILKNMWEYYVTDENTGDENIKFCVVLGFENEMGDVYMPEIKPYVLTRTKKLSNVLPAEGWNWL